MLLTCKYKKNIWTNSFLNLVSQFSRGNSWPQRSKHTREKKQKASEMWTFFRVNEVNEEKRIFRHEA